MGQNVCGYGMWVEACGPIGVWIWVTGGSIWVSSTQITFKVEAYGLKKSCCPISFHLELQNLHQSPSKYVICPSYSHSKLDTRSEILYAMDKSTSIEQVRRGSFQNLLYPTKSMSYVR